MSIDSFEATQQLDDGALRALLEGGQPEQRVWAAWRVALRVGGALPHIVERVASEPSAGVRRALVVVLAGYGEIDVLVALGRHDPAVEVSAYAMHFVTKLAVNNPAALAVVVETFAAGPSPVRSAILAGVAAGAPEELTGIVLGALAGGPPSTSAGGEAEEQLEAFEAALRIGTPETRAAALRWLDAAKGTLEFDAWGRLRQSPPAEIVELLLGTTLTLRERALARLPAVPIADLAPLAFGGTPRTYAIVRTRPDFARAPLELLVRAILVGCAAGYVEPLATRLRALEAAPAELVPLWSPLHEHVLARLAAVAERRFLPEERPERGWHVRAEYEALRKQLRRLG